MFLFTDVYVLLKYTTILFLQFFVCLRGFDFILINVLKMFSFDALQNS